MEFTLGYLLRRSAIKFPQKTAIVSGASRITYDELNRRANRLANALRKAGVRKGDKIASILFNSSQLIEVYFAAAKLGAVSVPVNYRLVSTEVNYILHQSDSSVLIYDVELEPIVAATDTNGLLCISIGKTAATNSIPYEDFLANSTDEEIQQEVTERDLRFIMYTSGTTGFPKGAMFSHANNLWAALSLIINKKYDFNECVLFVNPLYHMNSYINVIACIFMGNKMVVMRKFEPLQMMALMEKEEVTMCSMVPTICQRLLQLPPEKKFHLEKWRYCTSTGAPWPFDMKKAFMAKFPHVVMADAYGATEVFSGTLIQGEEILKKQNSVGRQYLDTIIKIVNERKEELPAGQIGEIAFYGPHVTLGYYKNPEATKESLIDGWFFPGDLGYFDEDGYLFLVDRKKDMIISGGENIYSLEIENVLLKNEKVLEVAVVGVPDDQWGEVVKVYIVLRPNVTMDKEEVIKFCGQRLASYKKPRFVEFVDSLPKNSMGKIMKVDLRRPTSAE